MRRLIPRLSLVLLLLAFGAKTFAQTCNGALGDPIIDVDFGSGANPGPPLPTSVTNMPYFGGPCPSDGFYTIANSSGDCFKNAWYTLTQDHTGNPNGYMMIVNATYTPSIFYTQQTLPGQLCPNTTYQFAAWICNLELPTTCKGNSILPNITFTIETTGGTILQTYNTGNIPVANDVEWKQYGTFFTTLANSSEAIVVKMSNNAPGGCGNDFALDDITFRACGPIVNTGFGSSGGPANIYVCQGSNAVYTLNANVVGDNDPVYQWQSNTNGGAWADVAGYTSNTASISFSNAAPGVYQYRLGIANGSNVTSALCRVYSKPLTVTVNPAPAAPLPVPDQTICEGSQITLTAAGGTSYLWTGPGISQSTQNPLVINNATLANSGNYSVVAVSDSGCTSAPVTAKVTVLPKIVPAISPAVAICAGESTQLNASGGSSYLWTPATGLDNDTIANPIATPLQTTTYTAHISNGACVDSSQSVTVTVYQNPIANAGKTIYLFQGQQAILQGNIGGDNITNYYWTPATYLSDPTSLNPIASPPSNITYTLTVNSGICGSATSSVFVRVYENITIPNTFSPNGDGINDLWNIDALVTYPEASVQVFDRYGQQVFQSIGYARPWDGTTNGKPVPAGTYYYIIDLKDGTPKRTGWVLVVK